MRLPCRISIISFCSTEIERHLKTRCVPWALNTPEMRLWPPWNPWGAYSVPQTLWLDLRGPFRGKERAKQRRKETKQCGNRFQATALALSVTLPL